MDATKVGTLVTALLNAGYKVAIAHSGSINNVEQYRVSASGLPVTAAQLTTFASTFGVVSTTGSADFD